MKTEKQVILDRIALIGSDWRKADSHVKADACDYLIRDLEALESRVPSEAGGWQPIETAPDSVQGEYPDYGLYWNGHHVGVGYTYVEDDGEDTRRFSDEGGEFIEPPPTHWQPLPAPPSADPAPPRGGEHTWSGVEDTISWLFSALTCKEFKWDQDQREAAAESLQRAQSELTQLRAAVEPSAWLPIGTAPRDGTKILLLANVRASDGKPRAGSGFYSVDPYRREDDRIIGAEEGFKRDSDQCIPLNQDCFIAWAPIPALPVTKTEGAS